jgi:hypothetical protein
MKYFLCSALVAVLSTTVVAQPEQRTPEQQRGLALMGKICAEAANSANSAASKTRELQYLWQHVDALLRQDTLRSDVLLSSPEKCERLS